MPDTNRNEETNSIHRSRGCKDIGSQREILISIISGRCYLEGSTKKSWKKRKVVSSSRTWWIGEIAGDLVMEENAVLTTADHVLRARNIAKPLEQQVADRMIERELCYAS